MPAKPVKNAVLINMGAMMPIWTSGNLKAVVCVVIIDVDARDEPRRRKVVVWDDPRGQTALDLFRLGHVDIPGVHAS